MTDKEFNRSIARITFWHTVGQVAILVGFGIIVLGILYATVR